ncbi:ABC transporter ATP-binding protein [Bartonella rattaustraliani]|uniref:ATP-binding cassette domain-containing protein n=1 Tax=Bartonella rattaustraliani TaxID=481139 RepID=UPI0002EA2481|nr:ABC transporter ATP-binding protein [Bartonella rattaustraliani]
MPSVLHLKAEGQTLKIPAFCGLYHYNKLVLEYGKAYSLCGHSGSEKSQYLKALANIAPATYNGREVQFDGMEIYYLNRISADFLDQNITGFIDILKIIPQEPNQLILLDEIFMSVETEAFIELCKQLENYARTYKSIIIVVDHRFCLPTQLDIHDLLSEKL